MSSTTSRGWVRLIAGKHLNCPVCGHDGGCLLSHDGGAVICIRIQQGCATRRDGTPITAKDGMGHLHRLKADRQAAPAGKTARRLPMPSDVKIGRAELDLIVRDHQSAIGPRRLAMFAEDLGVSERALKLFGAGYDARTGSCSFPMFDGQRRIVGVKLRGRDGFKITMKGTSNGLFIPTNYDPHATPDAIVAEFGLDSRNPLALLLPEGPTDAAAAADLGFIAIGRPSNNGGADLIARLLADAPCKQDVVIVADHDPTKYTPEGIPFWPGWEGALSLAETILPACGTLKVIKPPDKSKDLRQWLRDRGGEGALTTEIARAAPVTPGWLRSKRAEVQLWKGKLKKVPAA